MLIYPFTARELAIQSMMYKEWRAIREEREALIARLNVLDKRGAEQEDSIRACGLIVGDNGLRRRTPDA